MMHIEAPPITPLPMPMKLDAPESGLVPRNRLEVTAQLLSSASYHLFLCNHHIPFASYHCRYS